MTAMTPTVDIKAPTLPESVPDGTIATWHKREGDPVSRDELLVDIETDKVVIEVVSPADGILGQILKTSGDTITSNEAIGSIQAGAASAAAPSPAKPEPPAKKDVSKPQQQMQSTNSDAALLSPAAKKLIAEHGLDPAVVAGSGKDGRVTKEDVLGFIQSGASKGGSDAASHSGSRREERVPMSRLRAKVAERLLQATQSTAMLTTFNEVNMAPIMAIRARYKQAFEQAHNGTRLGFMSFFVRACTEALKKFPAVNASIDGDDMVYHGYQDIGVAVSSPRGLVVPVLRNAEHKSLAQIEREIRAFGEKAKDGRLAIEDMTGGTFTISNGGVFGSLLSTPILNPPQTAILGMHKIQERPVAVDGEIKILPMMYLALSYDHRMIDGREAVQFLVTVKDILEDPSRPLLENLLLEN